MTAESLPTDADSISRLRARRLNQISSLVFAGMGFALAGYAADGNWTIGVFLVVGMAVMLLCLVLNAFGKTSVATIVFLFSLTSVAAALMWVSLGINDVVVLSFPALLIMAGLLVPARAFFVLLAAMLGYLVLITLATDFFHWRTDGYASPPLEQLRDVLTILGVSGVAVWLILNDLQRALLSLQTQIGRFKESQRHLTYLSQHDGLTGLPNRSLGRERIERAIASAVRRKTRVALMFVDLDYFKSVNDSLGHAAGDDFLKQVAQRLEAALRRSDIVSRHGGDEFVLALVDPTDANAVTTAASTVLESLTQVFTVKDTEVSISCSIGVAMYPDDGQDYETLLRQADIAMYQAKESGRNAIRLYDPVMHTASQHNLHLVAGMRAALARHEFVLHYQPVFDLADGRLLGAEALVRWQHPEQGLLAPAHFIGAAEKSGLIVEIGAWVLQEACRQAAMWRNAGFTDCVMAVNLSVAQFRRGTIEEVVLQALQSTSLPPECLELEITESTLVQDTDKFLVTLQRLKAMGVKISIDDFGTGYSNLAYLQRFAVDKLKIDQSFVRVVLEGPQQRALVVAIIQMAKSLNLLAHAEGIEDEPVRQALQSLGCDVGQGYWFAKPQPAEEFARQFLPPAS